MNLKQQAITYVLQCFSDMGATAEQLKVEEQILTENEYLLDKWMTTTNFYRRKGKV